MPVAAFSVVDGSEFSFGSMSLASREMLPLAVFQVFLLLVLWVKWHLQVATNVISIRKQIVCIFQETVTSSSALQVVRQ